MKFYKNLMFKIRIFLLAHNIGHITDQEKTAIETALFMYHLKRRKN